MTRSPVPRDNVGAPCRCEECREAGVDQEPQRRVPDGNADRGSRWIHGWELKRYLEAQRAALDGLRSKAR